jgi:tetratricopeptide (TPR) repeat protein
MLAIDCFPLRRDERFGWGRLVREKAVLMALALAVGLSTMIMLSREGALVPLKTLPLIQRVFLMFRSLTFYPWKLVWPAGLLPCYPLRLGNSLGQPLAFASALCVGVVTVLSVRQRRRAPAVAAAWAAYVILVLPMSGLINKGMGGVALRYAYAAILPLLLVVGGAAVWAWRRSTTAAHLALIGLLAGQLCVFGARTRSLIPDWHNDETLQRAILAEFPDSEFDNRALALTLLEQGRASEALEYAQRDVEIAPQVWEAHMTLGSVLSRLGRMQEAMAQDEQALRMNPHPAEAHYNYGVAIMELGKVPEAVEHFEQALRIKPDFAQAHLNLGVALLKLGRPEDAIRHYEAAVQIQSDHLEAHMNPGGALVAQGRVQDAIAHYQEALRIKPDYAEAHNKWGIALTQTGGVSEAMKHWDEALRIKPDYAEAHYNYGVTLQKLGKIPEAIAHYEQALRIDPDFAEAHCNLGIALEKAGRVPEAIQHYEQALRLQPDLTEARTALARLQARQ